MTIIEKISEAMAVMRTSKSVKEWNRNRQKIHDQSTDEEWNAIYPYIDCDGFITRVLFGYVGRIDFKKS